MSAISNWDCIKKLLKLHTEAEIKLALKQISSAIKQYDPVTYLHSNNVAVYSGMFAKFLNMSKEEQRQLSTAGFLHDIGKLKVPRSIITKSSSLEDFEFDKVKEHPIHGGCLLSNFGFSKLVMDAVQMHHERYDGSGYPFGLEGEDIPLAARILAIVDCWDALSSWRPYRRALAVEDAFEIMEKNYHHFDPDLWALFKKIFVSKLPEKH